MHTRKMRLAVVLVALTMGVSWRAAATQAGAEQYAGMWTGTYDGAATGTMELILDTGEDGAMTGKVSSTTDGGNYTVDLKTVTFDGAKMSAKYDFPLDPSAEVIVTATFDGTAAKGTWSLRPKGQTDEIAGGGIAIAKK